MKLPIARLTIHCAPGERSAWASVLTAWFVKSPPHLILSSLPSFILAELEDVAFRTEGSSIEHRGGEQSWQDAV